MKNERRDYMDIIQSMQERHSVRRFRSHDIPQELVDVLQNEIYKCNQEGQLHIQLILQEPGAFRQFFVHYGRFKNVQNYIVLVGRRNDSLEERLGYYGERIVLKAQQLGLNTCWVGATYSSKKVVCQIDHDEQMICIIAIGYGDNQGKPHKNKPMESLYQCIDEKPDWFLLGMEAMMLAPTAMNQQKFFVTLKNNKVEIMTQGSYANINRGILKYHFEQGAHKTKEIWL